MLELLQYAAYEWFGWTRSLCPALSFWAWVPAQIYPQARIESSGWALWMVPVGRNFYAFAFSVQPKLKSSLKLESNWAKVCNRRAGWSVGQKIRKCKQYKNANRMQREGALVCYAFSPLSRPSSSPVLVSDRALAKSIFCFGMFCSQSRPVAKSNQREKSDYGDWHMAG